MKRFGKRQGGFTLIELLVVVGIMAALAAIIVPNVARFVGSGQEEGAQAEGDAVQAAVDAGMADLGLRAGELAVGADVVDFSLAGNEWSLADETVLARDVNGDGDSADVIYLYPDYLRIEVAKYGSTGVAGSGWDISADGQVTLYVP